MTTQRSSVRIIGGEHKSRRLRFTDQKGDLRPSTDRVRETLFNWIQFDVAGKTVLDLFAGSGILAAEALSRGAARAELVEKKSRRADDLRHELKPLFGQQIRVHSQDALKWLAVPGQTFDLVFVDPPYHLEIASSACHLLQNNGHLAAQAFVYVETQVHAAPPEVPSDWQLHREKLAGEAAARLYRIGA